jgi:uncharacterized membrane protein YccC
MNKSNAYHGLDFNLPRRRISPRIITVVITIILFSLIWWVIPHYVLFWLLLPLLAGLSWMASYGWRQGISILVRFLQNLERM